MLRHAGFVILGSLIIFSANSAVAQNDRRPGTQAQASQGSVNPAPPKAPSKPSASASSWPKWEVEVHGGAVRSEQKGGYTLPPAAETYSLVGSGAQGYESVRVSTWYLGDGATLIGASDSLADTLTKPIVKPEDKLYGFRVSRALSKRFAAEFTLDRGGRLAMTDAAIAGIKAADATFKGFWNRLSVPGNTATSSEYIIRRYGGRQIFTTGAVVVHLLTTGRVVPFVTAGLGVLISGDGNAGATLQGSYGGPAALETDTLQITASPANSRSLTEMVGGGLKFHLTQHLGVRVDARAYFYKNAITTYLDASHTNTANKAWVVNAKTRTGAPAAPAIQLLSGPGVESYSTLSGPPISKLPVFKGNGTQYLLPITAGVFWRF